MLSPNFVSLDSVNIVLPYRMTQVGWTWAQHHLLPQAQMLIIIRSNFYHEILWAKEMY